VAPPELAGRIEALARVCVPALVERMGEMAERFEALAGDLARGRRSELEALRRIEADEELGPELGYLLGVLAAARGTDVLLVRRAAGGARMLVGTLAGALGARLRPDAGALPDTRAWGGGWESALALGMLFHAELRAGCELAWSFRRDRRGWIVGFPGSGPAPARAAARALAPLGVRPASRGALLPALWFCPGNLHRGDTEPDLHRRDTEPGQNHRAG